MIRRLSPLLRVYVWVDISCTLHLRKFPLHSNLHPGAHHCILRGVELEQLRDM